VPEGPPRQNLSGVIGRRQWLVTVVLVVLAGLSILLMTNGQYPHQMGPRLLFALVACGPFVLLRRWPLPMLGVAGIVSALFLAAFGASSLPLSMVSGLAMYFAASRLPRRVTIPAGVSLSALLGAALLDAMMVHANGAWLSVAVAWFLPLGAAWFVGDAVAARRRYVAGLAEQAERQRAAEVERARQDIREERVRIARELHDVVAHTLAVMTVQAGVGRRLMDRRPEAASAALESIETIGRTAQDELRVVLGLLRDEEGASAALAPAPRLADLPELAETVRASGTPVDLRMSGTERRLSPALELSLYRVVQEALTNVVRHAPGARATVGLSVAAGQVRLEVADDGGAPVAGNADAATAPGPGSPGPAGTGTGHGIVGMRERVTAFGGWLVAERLAGRGFRVAAEVPAGEAV
jgi:signal transduction histidine kinase